ncbi:MAG: hypothetical protein ABIA76_01720 [Candidatus Diapherotrites archaeon]
MHKGPRKRQPLPAAALRGVVAPPAKGQRRGGIVTHVSTGGLRRSYPLESKHVEVFQRSPGVSGVVYPSDAMERSIRKNYGSVENAPKSVRDKLKEAFLRDDYLRNLNRVRRGKPGVPWKKK